jgi:hypothetical protein
VFLRFLNSQTGLILLPSFSGLLTQIKPIAEKLTFLTGWYEIRLPLPPPRIENILSGLPSILE